MAGDAGWGQLSPAGELLTQDLGPTELTSGLTCNYLTNNKKQAPAELEDDATKKG